MRLYASPLSRRPEGLTMIELQRRMSQVFDEARARQERVAEPRRIAPPADLGATEDAYLIRLDLPGVAADAVKVVAEEGLVVVRGTKAPAQTAGSKVRSERRYGEFLRSFQLPSDADAERMTARLAEGVLTVTIARRAAAQRREVPVEEA
jgi:HSP20 family protein